MSRIIHAADLFCGAGGSSTGLAAVCQRLNLSLQLTAINHWDVAIQTHTANHPDVQHLCESLDNVDPRKVVRRERLDLLVASPECTHHSVARGGKPMQDQSRASAWHVLRWAEALYIDSIIVENVPEFLGWGPLGANGRPLKKKKGETFRAWVAGLESLGYRVEWRILNAADYGDPTSRRRLFVMARRGGKPVRWPEPTHFPTSADLFGSRQTYRTAREIIDWSIPGQSIFRRKKPLAPKTLKRIEAGIRKFCGDAAEPFLVILRGTSSVRSIHEPLPTVTSGGGHVGVVQPFLVPFYGEREGQAPRVNSVEEPPKTATTENRFGLCQPFVMHLNQGDPMVADSVEKPLRTITASSADFALVEPFLVQLTHGGRVRSVEHPLPTIPAGHRGEFSLVEPFIVKYFGTADAKPVDQPLDTVTAKDRYGLVEPVGDGYLVDILFRMLQPHELAAAMGFPAGYEFAGTKTDAVRQIGNAVPVGLAAALCEAVLEESAQKRATA